VEDIKLTLDLTSVPAVDSEVATRTLTEAGYRFFTLAQAGDDEATRRKLYSLVREGVHDTAGFTGEFERYEAFIERIYTRSYGQHAESQFLAAYADDWVGLSSFVGKPDGGGIFGLTVVTREHRCRGIARALKLLGLQYAQKNSIGKIVTENHPENAPILGLNQALGFTKPTSGV